MQLFWRTVYVYTRKKDMNFEISTKYIHDGSNFSDIACKYVKLYAQYWECQNELIYVLNQILIWFLQSKYDLIVTTIWFQNIFTDNPKQLYLTITIVQHDIRIQNNIEITTSVFMAVYLYREPFCFQIYVKIGIIRIRTDDFILTKFYSKIRIHPG